MFPQSVIQGEIVTVLNAYARPRKLGHAFPELRAVFGGAAQVPAVSFYTTERLPKIVRGQNPLDLMIPPDITIEILSPGQTPRELRHKIRQAIRYGTKLGWLFHPTREEVEVLRPGSRFETLKTGDHWNGENILPGFSVGLDEIYGWLDPD
jgi:Uma2 family endonuclease